MVNIHPSALVHPKAQLGIGVNVGAFTIIGEHVSIGDGTSIGSHCVIEGHTTIGRDNNIHHYAALGGVPQDKKYNGEPTRLEIGDRNTIREFVSFNVGTVQDKGVTSIGSDNWVMGYVHVAHDCRIGNQTILASNAQLAGHCEVGDWAILGGHTGYHQFVRIGAHAMIGGGSMLVQDVPPFVMAQGYPTIPRGINAEGLKRRGYTSEAINAIKQAYRVVYKSGLSMEEARLKLDEIQKTAPEVGILNEFLASSQRGIIR
ncbi:MAG: acyl-[acyl-carrier-protein]--UDP-N-acetylglucosam ine O-acyltransferase [Pseudomonadota bacterium]|jgi:UDP-N-acetylglucosamine acyltransferase